METETWSEFRDAGKATVESILSSKEIQENMAVRVTVRDPSKKIKHLSKVGWGRKSATKFTRSITSAREG